MAIDPWWLPAQLLEKDRQDRLVEALSASSRRLVRLPAFQQRALLRKHHRSGESVSNSSTVPDPILTIGDQKTLCVRVDVDETDVSKSRGG